MPWLWRWLDDLSYTICLMQAVKVVASSTSMKRKAIYSLALEKYGNQCSEKKNWCKMVGHQVAYKRHAKPTLWLKLSNILFLENWYASTVTWRWGECKQRSGGHVGYVKVDDNIIIIIKLHEGCVIIIISIMCHCCLSRGSVFLV